MIYIMTKIKVNKKIIKRRKSISGSLGKYVGKLSKDEIFIDLKEKNDRI